MRERATGLEKRRGFTRIRPHCDEGRVTHFRLGVEYDININIVIKFKIDINMKFDIDINIMVR